MPYIAAERGVRVLLAICVGVWLLALGVQWHQYYAASSELTAAVGRRAMKIAQMAVLVLEPYRADYFALALDDPATRADARYLSLLERMRAVQAQFDDVRFVYTERVESELGYLTYILDAAPPDSEDFSPIGERDYDLQDTALRDGTAGFDSGLHHYVRWGALLTGWAPIRDDRGTLHSYAAVDIDANQLAAELASVRNSALLGALVTSVVMLASGGLGYRQLRERIQQLDSTTRDAEHFRHLATHDSLTALPNRWYATERLQAALSDEAGSGRPIAVLYLDIDGFKAVNDRYGHACGDQVLIATTRRMRACVRDSDIVARLAGDEFLVVLPNSEDERVATRVAQELVDALSAPVRALGASITVSVSIGIACHPQHGDNVETLLAAADGAMYAAKQAGKRCYRVAPVLAG
jgi:diguanylate cyclase (GGDEF)-like protein